MKEDTLSIVNQAIALLESRSYDKRAQGILIIAEFAGKVDFLSKTLAQRKFWHFIQHILSSSLDMDYLLEVFSLRMDFSETDLWGLRADDLYPLKGQISLQLLLDPKISETVLKTTIDELETIGLISGQDWKRLGNLAEYARALCSESETQSILLGIIRNSDDPFIRSLAVHALRMNLEFDSFETLAELISDKDAQIRGAAITALSLLEDRPVLELIRRGLEDEAASVRLITVYTLANMEKSESLYILKDALEQGTPDVRIAVALRLSRIGKQRENETIIGWLKERIGEENDPSVHEALSEALKEATLLKHIMLMTNKPS